MQAIDDTIQVDALPAFCQILTVLQGKITEDEKATFAEIRDRLKECIPARGTCDAYSDGAALAAFIEQCVSNIVSAGKAMGSQMAKLDKNRSIFEDLYLAMSAWSAYHDALQWAVRQWKESDGSKVEEEEVKTRATAEGPYETQ